MTISSLAAVLLVALQLPSFSLGCYSASTADPVGNELELEKGHGDDEYDTKLSKWWKPETTLRYVEEEFLEGSGSSSISNSSNSDFKLPALPSLVTMANFKLTVKSSPPARLGESGVAMAVTSADGSGLFFNQHLLV